MPTVTEVPTVAYAHCPEPRCVGYNQVEVEAFVRTTSFTYQERGGDIPGTESSYEVPVFAHEEDAGCEHCAPARAAEGLGPRLRELSLTPRKQYANLSGFDDGFLLQPNARAVDPTVRNTEADEKLAALEAQVALLLQAQSAGDEDGE